MLTGSTVFAAAIGYVLLLFLIAWWGDNGGRGFCRPPAHARLCAEPRGLLHLLDLLRLGRPRLGARARFPADLYRADPGRRLRPQAGRAHRRTRARAEPDHRRRLRLRALRQVAERRGARGADRADGLGALYRAATEGDHADDPDGARVLRARQADAGRAFAAVLARGRRCCSPCSRWRSAPGGSIRPSISTA